jgi:hypothetical protein
MSRIPGVTKGGSLLARIGFAISRKRLGKVAIPLRLHALNTRILFGYAQMELAQDAGKSVPASLKKLASVRAATRIGCPF